MRLALRLALSTLLVPALITAGTAGAGASTVVFHPGDATSVVDGKVTCVMGNTKGKGSATCSGRSVYNALWKGTKCDDWTRYGCVYQGRIRAVHLAQTGRPVRGWIAGLGGVMDVKRGQDIKAAKLTGRHLATGGFRFTNASGHGFKVTDKTYVAH